MHIDFDRINIHSEGEQTHGKRECAQLIFNVELYNARAIDFVCSLNEMLESSIEKKKHVPSVEGAVF